MKTLRINFLFILILLASFTLLTNSCADNSTGPQVDDTNQVDNNDDDDDNGEPTEPPPSDDFVINSDDVTKTDSGFRFSGSLSGINGNGVEFLIGEGEFEVVLDVDSTIVSISGTGLPEFPDIGVYKELLQEFAWSKVQSHIEYYDGSHYINEYQTDIPLNPDRKYLHFRVFDESKDGKFELRRRANDFIYNFADLYIDINDPAIFFKTQVPIPDGDGGEADGAVKSFWEKVAQIAAEKGINIGENLFDVDDDTYIIIGLSNEGSFSTPEYKLSEFGMKESVTFEELTGYDYLPGLPSHAYFKFVNFPIPGTYGLLELSGDMSSHSENGNKIIYVDILANRKNFARTESYSGELSFTAPGLALVLEGILPAIDEYTGRDLFGEDIDLSPIEGFLQYQASIPGQNPAFLRFGGSTSIPLLADIFGEDIKKFLISKPSPNYFSYYSIGPDLDNSFYYTEADMQMVIPYYGQEDLLSSYFFINKDGISFSSLQELQIGPIHVSSEGNGSIHKEGFNYSASIIRDITLPNEVILGNRELSIDISSETGATVSGQVILPFSIGQAEVTGQVITEGLTMSGKVSAGSVLALNTGLTLPSRDLELSVSTNPDSALSLYGETQMPFVGYQTMTGILNKNQFLFKGEIDRTLTIGNLDVPISNGQLTIDSNQGVFLDGNIQLPHLGSAELSGEISEQKIFFEGAVNRNILFSGNSLYMAEGDITLNESGGSLNGTLELPANLKTAQVSGNITSGSLSLTGSLGNSLSFYGQDFAVSNSSITASTNSGVTASFDIRLLSSLTADVSGTISETGYVLTASNGFSRSVNWSGFSATLSGSISTRLTQDGITLTGTGRVTYTGALGQEREPWSGTLSIQPDWSGRSIRVCVPGTSVCANI